MGGADRLSSVPGKAFMGTEKKQQFQIKFTPSEQQDKTINRLVEVGYLSSPAAVVASCVSRVLPVLAAEAVKLEQFLNPQPENSLLRELMARFAAGEFVSDEEITLAAHDTGVAASVLRQIRDCLTTNNGEKANVRSGR